MPKDQARTPDSPLRNYTSERLKDQAPLEQDELHDELRKLIASWEKWGAWYGPTTKWAMDKCAADLRKVLDHD